MLHKLYLEDTFLCLIWLTLLGSCSDHYTCHRFPNEILLNKVFFQNKLQVLPKHECERQFSQEVIAKAGTVGHSHSSAKA